jgi:hypothetical protein
MLATPNKDRCRMIARHMITERARDKVTCALYEAVVEGLEFGPRDLPQPEDREWIRGIVAVPLQEAADAALEVLAWSVSRALARAPEGLLDRFERSHHLEYLGLD